MSWLEQIPTIILTLLGISLFRSFIRSQWPSIKETHLDIFLVLIFIVSLAISLIDKNKQARQDEEYQRTIDALRNYSVVARLNPYGLQGIVGLGLVESSPLSKVLEGAWSNRDGKLYSECDDSVLEKFRPITISYPQFPFTHFGLAICLRTRGDKSWRDHAKKAIEILEKTTLLAGHHPSHDQALNELRGYLNAP